MDQAKPKKQIAPASQAIIVRADRRNHSGSSRKTNPEIPIEISSLGRAAKTLNNFGLGIDERTRYLWILEFEWQYICLSHTLPTTHKPLGKS